MENQIRVKPPCKLNQTNKIRRTLNHLFNKITSLSLVCSITRTDRDFPLHVSLDERTKATGVIMCEQVKSLDITARNAVFQEKIPTDILEEVIDILTGFIE